MSQIAEGALADTWLNYKGTEWTRIHTFVTSIQSQSRGALTFSDPGANGMARLVQPQLGERRGTIRKYLYHQLDQLCLFPLRPVQHTVTSTPERCRLGTSGLPFHPQTSVRRNTDLITWNQLRSGHNCTLTLHPMVLPRLHCLIHRGDVSSGTQGGFLPHLPHHTLNPITSMPVLVLAEHDNRAPDSTMGLSSKKEAPLFEWVSTFEPLDSIITFSNCPLCGKLRAREMSLWLLFNAPNYH